MKITFENGKTEFAQDIKLHGVSYYHHLGYTDAIMWGMWVPYVGHAGTINAGLGYTGLGYAGTIIWCHYVGHAGTIMQG